MVYSETPLECLRPIVNANDAIDNLMIAGLNMMAPVFD